MYGVLRVCVSVCARFYLLLCTVGCVWVCSRFCLITCIWCFVCVLQVLSHNLCTVLCIPHDPAALEEHFRDDDDGPVSSQGYMPYLNKYILDKVPPVSFLPSFLPFLSFFFLPVLPNMFLALTKLPRFSSLLFTRLHFFLSFSPLATAS